MSLTAIDHKIQGNKYYSNRQTSLAIQSYSEAIKLLENNVDENLPLYLVYSNRSAAYIQEKDFYSGYQDAKHSLKLQKKENFKGFYRAALCAYHLGFIDKSEKYIEEAIKEYQANPNDYASVKLLIAKKVKCMAQYRRRKVTAKRVIKIMGKVIEQGFLLSVIPGSLYQLRYLLRAYFGKKADRKLMNVNVDNLGFRLHELAVAFNSCINVEKLIQKDPLFQDLILNEMPDVGPVRLREIQQRSLPRDERDYDLKEAAADDLAAYQFSFFINNVLAALVVQSSDQTISLRALKQLHRLTTIDLYRQALGDALSDALNTYIYSQSKNTLLLDKLVSNGAVDIFFYDYIEASCHMAASRMIKHITADQWKRQSPTTIQFVLKQITKKMDNEGIELVEPKAPSQFQLLLETALHLNTDEIDRKEDLHLIVNVLTKIYMTFDKQPFLERSTHDPFHLFVIQTCLERLENDKQKNNKDILCETWISIITQWLQLDYAEQKIYFDQLNMSYFDDDD